MAEQGAIAKAGQRRLREAARSKQAVAVAVAVAVANGTTSGDGTGMGLKRERGSGKRGASGGTRSRDGREPSKWQDLRP